MAHVSIISTAAEELRGVLACPGEDGRRASGMSVHELGKVVYLVQGLGLRV